MCPEQFFRMQELLHVFGYPFASCGFLACVQVVESPLEIIKTHLDAILSNVL